MSGQARTCAGFMLGSFDPTTMMNNSGELVSRDEEKAEILNNLFASVFTGKSSSHGSHVDGPQVGDQGDKVPSTVSEDKVHEQPHLWRYSK